jgi:predicted DNA-binding ribbon-helix-helix protein
LDTLSRDNIDARPRAVELADGRFMVVELESFLWDCLDQICDESNLSVSSLCSLISTTFPDMAMRHALSSYIVEYFRQARPA